MNLKKVFNFIKEKKGYDVPTLYKLLNDIPLPDDEKTEFINNLNSGEIYNLIYGSKESDRIINILLSSNEFINKLDTYGINTLLGYSKEPDKIKELIRKYRPDIQLNESKLKLSNLI